MTPILPTVSVLPGTVPSLACTGALATYAHWSLLALEDVLDALATTKCVLITGAWRIAVSLILRPFPANVSATPTLVPLLHTCEAVSSAIATVLAFWDSQGGISTSGAHVFLKEWHLAVLGIAAQGSPSGGRGTKRAAAGSGSCGGRSWSGGRFCLV
jgi:hypothetical protein